MTKKEIIEVLNYEIKWCIENKGYIGNMPEDFVKGFIDGLKQAKKLIQKIPATNR